jgi:DNA-directed RNA polymerase specialized sigma24 family protein
MEQMSSPGSVTFWIGQLKAGDSAAAQQLWTRYFQRLVGLARKKLHDRSRRAADEEDVALSAFASFCRRAEQGQFPQLQDRNDLWHLLMVLTVRKTLNQIKHEGRQKRGGKARAVSSSHGEPAAEEAALEEIIGREPTPEFAAQIAEECQRLLDRLADAELRAIALAKMEGNTNEQIAATLRRAPRTIERRLQLIRKMWQEEIGP